MDFDRSNVQQIAGGYMSVTGGIIAGASLLGSAATAGTSLYGAGKQSDAATTAANLQKQQYDQTRQDQLPFIQQGQTAVNTIGSDIRNKTGFATPFDFQADPGYKFNLQQGQEAINNSAAAKGGVLNGGTLKALSQYTSGLADTTYNSAYNRYLQGSQNSYNQLAGLANLGEGATSNTGAAGENAANAQGNYLTQAGNATAAGAVGAGNAVSSGLGTIANGALDLSALRHLSSASSYGTPPPVNVNSSLFKDLA